MLWPWTISRTDRYGSLVPVLDVWAGPLFGCLLPLVLALLLPPGRWRRAAWSFAGFCLLANGAYLLAVLVEPVGDVVDLLDHGTPVAVIACTGALGLIAGLAIWHRCLQPTDSGAPACSTTASSS